MSEEKKKIKQTQKEADFKPRIRIKVKSYDHRVIDEALKSIIEAVKRSDAKIIGPIFLPTEIKKFTVLRSSFVHKDARDQFEKRIHKRLIDITDFDPKTIETLTSLRLPAGVDIEIKL
ncbi:MAG: 30S ribosomal protein S10 [Patescibacteria group bacterium]|jgi:small subunit ribosomal protein S10|nr:30S ribosomal protein S10 [Patescibacteria group bacterium]MDD5164777.1 30S ribosomal protein S10 [Patescibacteria group bacterium]MDD5534801.1 30S ribosomal protein S10 [Patescibacteria group bacterium]MDD5626341.1 30S ribosomal protein S10 [Patescibacteria group bacterium]